MCRGQQHAARTSCQNHPAPHQLADHLSTTESGNKAIARLRELQDEHVQRTKTLCNTHFPQLVKDCDLKFSSKVVTDVLHALASDSDFMYLFRGTYPGAKGKTIGSRTDTNLRGAIGEGSMNSLFTDMNCAKRQEDAVCSKMRKNTL